MNGVIPEGFDWAKMFESLQKQVVEGTANLKDFKQARDALERMHSEFLRLLEQATKDQRGKEKSIEFERLYRLVAGWKASELMETLKSIGFALKKHKELKDAFDRQGYRILELVRAGRRDEVFHSILRIFVSTKERFPEILVEAFKPVYSDDLFKVFLFSFLTGILGKEEKEENI